MDDIEHWSSRSGVVKINCAISKLPTLAGEPDWRDFSGGFEIAPSIDQLERSFEEARAGRPATLPFSDGVIPTTLDPSLAPKGAHVVSLFTQWVPHTWSEEPHREELEAYADRVVQAYEDVAPGFRESIVARQVLGPYDMETEWNLIGGNIFHGELSADQLFHMRPAPGYADYRTPIDGLYQCSSATHGGGGVSGIPAYNCVREIRRDRKRRGEASMKEPYSFTFYTASWYRRSPYWQRTVEAGCTSWDLYNHMLIPTLYDDDEAEYWHLVEHVGLWDVAVERQVEITGPDAARFTQLLTCRDLSRCDVLQCKYAPIIAPSGGIVNDPILLRLGENHFWLSLADSDAMLYALGVQAFAGMDVTIREPDVSPLQVQGPKSKDVIRALFGDEVADLRYYRCWEGDLGSIPVVVSRTGWTGEVGYEIYLRDGSRGSELWDRVMEAGEAAPDPGDRAERPAAARGRDLQLRQRHDGGGHAVPRERDGAPGRVRGGVHRQGSAPTGRGRGRRPQARRRDARRRALPDVARGLLGRSQGRSGRRPSRERLAIPSA